MTWVPIRSNVQTEVREFLKLSSPLVVAQLTQVGIGFVDTVMMGHLGSKVLAAGGLASITFLTLLTVASGIVTGVTPPIAEAFGGGHKARIEQVAQQGLWLSFLVALALMLVMASMDALMRQLGSASEIFELAKTYLDIMLWGLLPAVVFAMLRGVVTALSQSRPIMLIVFGGTLFNIAGNYVLGFGKFGFPRMELAGLALASVLSLWGMCLALTIYMLRQPQLRSYSIFQGWYRLKLLLLWQVAKIGIPIGISLAFEYGLITVMAYMMTPFGADVLAANQIVMQTGLIVYSVPLAMSAATTARVGQWLGKASIKGIKLAGNVGLGVAGLSTAAITITLLIFARQVTSLYIDPRNPENADVLIFAVTMLRVLAVGINFDGIQKIMLGALYGLQDTRVPMLLGILFYWGIGLPSSYVMGFPLGLGGVGIWVGCYIGFVVAAAIFVWRFHRLVSNKKLTETLTN
jgi:MATE family multidrug resistance protein